MKRAVSISIGSSKRDKAVEIDLLGERIRIERIGTDGDMEKAARLFQELDGHVDAFGVGGADLAIVVDGHAYPLYSARKLVRYVRKTPYVDGAGLKNTLERQLAGFIERTLGDQIQPKRAFINLGSDRWGMSSGFIQEGYECIFGDLMFALGVNVPLRSLKSVKRMARILLPVVGRIPICMAVPDRQGSGEAHASLGPGIRLGNGDRRRRVVHHALHAGAHTRQSGSHQYHDPGGCGALPSGGSEGPRHFHAGAGGSLVRHQHDGSGTRGGGREGPQSDHGRAPGSDRPPGTPAAASAAELKGA